MVERYGGLRSCGDGLRQLDDWGLAAMRRLLIESPVKPVTLSPAAAKRSHSAGNQNATDSAIIQGTAAASSLARGITLPAETMVVLESSRT